MEEDSFCGREVVSGEAKGGVDEASCGCVGKVGGGVDEDVRVAF